jgi:hypothetical protein
VTVAVFRERMLPASPAPPARDDSNVVPLRRLS